MICCGSIPCTRQPCPRQEARTSSTSSAMSSFFLLTPSLYWSILCMIETNYKSYIKHMFYAIFHAVFWHFKPRFTLSVPLYFSAPICNISAAFQAIGKTDCFGLFFPVISVAMVNSLSLFSFTAPAYAMHPTAEICWAACIRAPLLSHLASSRRATAQARLDQLLSGFFALSIVRTTFTTGSISASGLQEGFI